MSDPVALAIDTSVKLLAGGVVCALVTRRAGLASAARAHVLWGLTLAAFLAVPLLDLLVAPVAAVVPAPVVRDVVSGRLGPVSDTLLWLYGTGVILFLAQLIAGLAGVRRLLDRAIVLPGEGDGGLAEALARECAACGAGLMESDGIAAPATAGFRRPRVLLPEGWRDLDPDAVRAAVRHELAHVRRFDYLVTVVAAFVRAVFWFHPVAWLACARVRWFAELACDEAASESIGHVAYADAILAVAARRQRRHPQFALSAGSRVGRRVRMLMDDVRGARLPPLPACAALVLMVLWLGSSIRVSAGARSVSDGGALHAARHGVLHAARHH